MSEQNGTVGWTMGTRAYRLVESVARLQERLTGTATIWIGDPHLPWRGLIAKKAREVRNVQRYGDVAQHGLRRSPRAREIGGSNPSIPTISL